MEPLPGNLQDNPPRETGNFEVESRVQPGEGELGSIHPGLGAKHTPPFNRETEGGQQVECKLFVLMYIFLYLYF